MSRFMTNSAIILAVFMKLLNIQMALAMNYTAGSYDTTPHWNSRIY